MDELSAFAVSGISLPSPAYIVGAVLFGLLGFAAYRYGKKTQRPPHQMAGRQR